MWICNVLNMGNFGFEICHTPPMVEIECDDDSYQNQSNKNSCYHASITHFLTFLYSRIVQGWIAIFSGVAMTTNTAFSWMADKVVIFTFTGSHTMVTVVTLWANCKNWDKKAVLLCFIKFTYFLCTVYQSNLVYTCKHHRSFYIHRHLGTCNVDCNSHQNALVHTELHNFCQSILASTGIRLKSKQNIILCKYKLPS